jgi:PIN domain nuclease of toxin-antitoxin system
MRLLLDTHVLLWWLADDPSLSVLARSLIAEPQNAVFVSAISHWEIRLKSSLGKLSIPQDFEERLRREPFEKLPLKAAHTEGLARLPWLHRDPFDRMLIAQAQGAGLRLLTHDAQLGAYGEAVLVAR